MFGRLRTARSTIVWNDDEGLSFGAIANTASGAVVDASCNRTITIKCLQQLYNAEGYAPSATVKDSIGITGYLEQFANIQDLQSFYADQRPDASNTFTFVSVKGGINGRNLTLSGAKAALDVQFAFGISSPPNFPAGPFMRCPVAGLTVRVVVLRNFAGAAETIRSQAPKR